MATLPQAPNDLRLNQRLAALHTRAERFAEAGVCCRTLQSIYSEAGYPEEATRYGELADRYEQRSALSAAPGFAIELPALPEETSSEEISLAAAGSAPWPAAPTQPAHELEFSVVADPGENQHPDPNQDEQNQENLDRQPADEAPAAIESHSEPAEIDLSSEWEDAITIEAEEPAAEIAELEIPSAVAEPAAHSAHTEAAKSHQAQPNQEKTAESIEEIRFYLEHGMPEQAAAAFEKLQALTPDEATLNALRSEIEAASHPASAVEEVAALESVSNFATDEPAAEFTIDGVIDGVTEEVPSATVDEPVAVEELPVETPAPLPPVEAVHVEAPAARHIQPSAPQPRAVEPVVASAPGVLQEFVSDLESSLGDSFLPGAVPHEPAHPVEAASAHAPQPEHIVQPELEAVGNATPTTFGVPQNEVIGEFVADLEASLGDDFLKDAPVPEPVSAPQAHPVLEAKPPVVATPAHHWPVPAPAPVSPAVSTPAVASAAAASASASAAVMSSQASAPVVQQSAHAASVAAVPPIIPGPPTAAKSSPFGEDAGVDLAEMFGELKQDLESGTTADEGDPETHYNLGIAFREMGLLDEAIGELQKTCQAVDRGHPFPQVMQTYTWLAQCFLDKGVPEAAIRWYQKALAAPGIDEETRTALHYELAAAYETAGDKPSALKHFMEVYGRNIDYRDVAERIKPLKS